MAIIGWIDTDTVKRRVKRVTSAYNEELRDEDISILDEKTLDSYYSILAALLREGYTNAQIDTWAQRGEYQRDIACCNYLLAIGFRRNDEQDWVQDFCKLSDLEDLPLVTTGGVLLEPGEPTGTPFSMFEIEEINDNLGITLP